MSTPKNLTAIFKKESRVSMAVNSIGALTTFLYLNVVDPIPTAEKSIRSLNSAASIVFIAILATVFFVGINWGNQHKKKFANWIELIESGEKTTDDVPPTVKRDVLNFPLYATGIAAMMWLIASTIAAYITQSSRVFFGLLGWGGLVSVTLLFFADDLIWRPIIPFFFPDGNLREVKAFRLPILGKLLIVFLFTNILTPTLLVILTWKRADILLTASNPETILANLHLTQIFILVVSILSSIGLGFCITRGITKPLADLRHAIKDIQNNNLDTKVIVTTNDELGGLGEHFNQMTAELHQKEILSNTNIQLREQLEKIKELENALREQAIRDPLTGLYNRRYMEETLQHEMAKAKRRNKLLSIVIFDVDHLKEINDNYGHVDGGDQALVFLADTIGKLCRKEDTFCRFAGDEFLVIMYDTSCETACERAREWEKALSDQQITVGEKEFGVRFSAGVAEFPAHGVEIEELIKCADLALYKTKETGRNNTMIYEQAKMN